MATEGVYNLIDEIFEQHGLWEHDFMANIGVCPMPHGGWELYDSSTHESLEFASFPGLLDHLKARSEQ